MCERRCLLILCFLVLASTSLMANPDFDQAQAGRFSAMVLDCVHQEYPNKIAHSLNSDADVKAPRELTPAFYGCLDWHSSVHGHWLLVRLIRMYPGASSVAVARVALARSFNQANVEQEVKYLNGEGRNSFERPYGLAWLLQLAAELRRWDDTDAHRWSATIRPLEEAIIVRIATWLPKLAYPVRTGEHNNTAFGMGLMLDYARTTGNAGFAKLLESRARTYFLQDRACPISYEPSGEDFLSPCLAEADLMRRILSPAEFATWFHSFLPHVDLTPTQVSDVNDGKLYHLAGLNLSRAWMLEAIASQLPGRANGLLTQAAILRRAGLDSIKSEHYEGGHWLGTFAVYRSLSPGY